MEGRVKRPSPSKAESSLPTTNHAKGSYTESRTVPRLVKRMGTPSPSDNLPKHPKEVQYETDALSWGERTRAGSILNPRAWAYSTNA